MASTLYNNKYMADPFRDITICFYYLHRICADIMYVQLSIIV